MRMVHGTPSNAWLFIVDDVESIFCNSSSSSERATICCPKAIVCVQEAVVVVAGGVGKFGVFLRK